MAGSLHRFISLMDLYLILLTFHPNSGQENGFWLMSVNYTEISVNEEEENEQNQYDNDNNKKKKKEAKGNRSLIFSFSKSMNRILSKIKRKSNISSSSHPSVSTSASSSYGFWKTVSFCGVEPPIGLECSSSCNPEPEDGNFSLRVLLQTNAFFSRDCNPHV